MQILGGSAIGLRSNKDSDHWWRIFKSCKCYARRDWAAVSPMEEKILVELPGLTFTAHFRYYTISQPKARSQKIKLSHYYSYSHSSYYYFYYLRKVARQEWYRTSLKLFLFRFWFYIWSTWQKLKRNNCNQHLSPDDSIFTKLKHGSYMMEHRTGECGPCRVMLTLSHWERLSEHMVHSSRFRTFPTPGSFLPAHLSLAHVF